METKKLTKEEFLEKLKTDKEFYKKYGRKNITEGKQVLPPCHYSWQVYTRELSQEERYNWYINTYNKNLTRSSNQFDMDDILNTNNIPKRAISLMWNQRSCDTFLGIPFNIASYGLLLEIIAKAVNMVPDELIGNLGDTHLYSNHVEQAREQIGREPYSLPNLVFGKTDEFFKSLGEDLSLITHLDNTDFVIENYQSHPTIKAPLSN
jgi:thymidylate synthase